MLRRLARTTAGGGVLATVLATGWVGAATLLGVALLLVGAVCWVIADPERPARLALLFTALRGSRDR
jgi:predicted small integral membrane protein